MSVGGESDPYVTEVNDYVSGVVDGCTVDRIATTTRFDHGENHAVYRVRYWDAIGAERDVVVRISNATRDVDREHAEREAAVLTHLQGAASPRLLSFDANAAAFAGRPVMCLEYIDGRFERLDTAPPDRMVELGSNVCRTHGVPIEPLAPLLGVVPDLAAYVDDRLHSMVSRMSLVCDPLPESTQKAFSDAATQPTRSVTASDRTHYGGTSAMASGEGTTTDAIANQ